MFKSMLATLVTSAAVGLLTFCPCKNDDEKLATLMQSAEPASQEGGNIPYCKQFREGVNKQFFLRGSPFSPCTVESSQSEMVLQGNLGKFELIEKLDNLRLVADEGSIEATSADYHYNNNILRAENAKITHKETKIRSDTAHYNGSTLLLVGNIVVNSELGDVVADKAIVEQSSVRGKMQATKITLEGNVRMVNGEKTQYAMADHVEYFPHEKTMIFTSDSRVYFYDKQKQIQLSAKKVRATRGTEDEIEGYGDVRFVFGQEELEQLKRLFTWDS